MTFFDNLLRYPKFFISSMLGLALIILTPFLEFLKKKDGKIIFVSGFILISLFIFLTLNAMINSNY